MPAHMQTAEVYQFEYDDDVNLTASRASDDVRMNACVVVYESDRDFGNLEQNPTSVTKPDCHDPPSTKIHSLSQMPDISDVSEKSKSKLTPVTGCREGYLQVATGKTTRVLISLSGVLSQIDVNGGYKTP